MRWNAIAWKWNNVYARASNVKSSKYVFINFTDSERHMMPDATILSVNSGKKNSKQFLITSGQLPIHPIGISYASKWYFSRANTWR